MDASGYYVSICLWPAVDSVRTGCLLDLDKANLRLVIGFVTIICNRFQPDYCKVCYDEEELQSIEHFHSPALSRLRLTICDIGFFVGFNSVSRGNIRLSTDSFEKCYGFINVVAFSLFVLFGPCNSLLYPFLLLPIFPMLSIIVYF